MTQIDGATPLEQGLFQIIANAPTMAKAIAVFGGMLWQTHKLPRRLRELLRLRIAFDNQCRSCMAIPYQSAVDEGLTEGMVCSLEKPYQFVEKGLSCPFSSRSAKDVTFAR